MLMEPEEIAKAFDNLERLGKVKKFGVSNMHSHHIQWLQTALDMPLVVNQMEMSLLSNDWLNQGVKP